MFSKTDALRRIAISIEGIASPYLGDGVDLDEFVDGNFEEAFQLGFDTGRAELADDIRNLLPPKQIRKRKRGPFKPTALSDHAKSIFKAMYAD